MLRVVEGHLKTMIEMDKRKRNPIFRKLKGLKK